jgi:SPP1 gp7 family putative phage head morphogenesis protein
MEEALLTRYLQYSLVRSGHIEQLVAEGQPVESIVKMVWKGLREIWEQNLADAMMEAFQRGYARVQRLMLPYQLQEFPWGKELTAVIRALAAEKVKIEENTTKAKIKEVVMDGIKEGLNPNDIAKNIHEKVGLAMARARNIASTEINFAYSLGHWVGAVEAGVEKVRIVAALDAFVCEHCRALDGKVLDVATLEAGYLPPFHFGCRCHLQPLLGSLARVPTSEDLPPRGDWVQKGFGIPGGDRAIQIAIERSLGVLADMRIEAIREKMKAIIKAPGQYAPSEERMREYQMELLEATDCMTLAQLRELNKVPMIVYEGEWYGGAGSAAGQYFPAGLKALANYDDIVQLGLDPDIPAITLRRAHYDVIRHEFAHHLSMTALPKQIWQEMVDIYGQSLEESIPLLQRILNDEKVAMKLGAREQKNLLEWLQMAQEATRKTRREYLSYIYTKLYESNLSWVELDPFAEEAAQYFPSWYGARNEFEFAAEAARVVARYGSRPGVRWCEMAERYLYPAVDEVRKADKLFHSLPTFSENGGEMIMQECIPLKRFEIIREGRRVGEVALGKGCLSYKLDVSIPQLRRELEKVKRTGVFPHIVAGGELKGTFWDRFANLDSLEEATDGLYYLMADFGLRLKEVD